MNDQYPRRQWWKWLPAAAMLLCILLFFWKGRSLSWQTLSDVMPEKPWQAALVFWGCYAVKSLSVFFPLLVLYAAAGRVFPLSKALLVNLIGLVICESIPYGIGRLSGTSLAAKLREKYPKLLALETLHQRGSFPAGRFDQERWASCRAIWQVFISVRSGCPISRISWEA